MILIWSTNNAWGSRLIRWGLDEPSSHFAVCFFEDNPSHATVIESRMMDGVDTCSLKDFHRRNEVIHMLQAPITADEEIELYNHLYNSTKGVEYDRPAILYWIYAGFMRKFFDRKLPKENIMDRRELLYCVEVLEILENYLEEIGVDVGEIDFGMMSPEQAYEMLIECESMRQLPC